MQTAPENTPEYEAPALRLIGTVHEMTQVTNKCGVSLDGFSTITGLSGDIVPVVCPKP